jgi:hypothetical protein
MSQRIIVKLLCMLAALMFITTVKSPACPICFSGRVTTAGQQLDSADQAILAVPVNDGKQFRIVAVVKGGGLVDGMIREPVFELNAAAIGNGKPLLLVRNQLAERWMTVGNIGAQYAGWLQKVAATGVPRRSGPRPSWPQTTQTGSELTDAAWLQRVALVLPYLEDPEPLAAEIAYGEIRRAPYSALRSLGRQLESTTIAKWVTDPKLVSRCSTYTLLLGIVGGPDDAALLEQRIDTAWKSRDSTNLPAMLAADLELHGPSRVARIEQMYFADRNRTLPEIEAALLALSVHGDTNGAVSRERVIEAYRLFMRERKSMAAFVAQQLADWEYWDATAEYVALLESNVVQDPGSHFAVVNYLQRSPRAAAKTALQSLNGDIK